MVIMMGKDHLGILSESLGSSLPNLHYFIFIGGLYAGDFNHDSAAIVPIKFITEMPPSLVHISLHLGDVYDAYWIHSSTLSKIKARIVTQVSIQGSESDS